MALPVPPVSAELPFSEADVLVNASPRNGRKSGGSFEGRVQEREEEDGIQLVRGKGKGIAKRKGSKNRR